MVTFDIHTLHSEVPFGTINKRSLVLSHRSVLVTVRPSLKVKGLQSVRRFLYVGQVSIEAKIEHVNCAKIYFTQPFK